VSDAYVVCHECKVGTLEDPSDAAQQGVKFAEKHLTHGLEIVPSMTFLSTLLSEGYKDVNRPDAVPLPATSGNHFAAATKPAPFGLPSSTRDAVRAHRSAATNLSRGRRRHAPAVAAVAPLAIVRPSWDDTFLEVAAVIAKRGTCSRLQVGAVLTIGNRIIATGYNGAPAGLRHCNHANEGDLEHGHCARAEHAERNALIFAGREARGGTMFLTCTPCLSCLRSMVTAGIVRIVYRAEYRPDPRVEELCSEAKILLERV
jgi:dCMP deaminase